MVNNVGRYKETGYLKLVLLESLCDNCKRWQGEFTDNDLYVCKYNKDKKGLNSGNQNYKCKYFKRNAEYRTFRFTPKRYDSLYKYEEGKIKRIVRCNKGKYKIRLVWNKGKYKIRLIKEGC